jgi:hypothetical protein
MRLTTGIAALVALLAPASVLAKNATSTETWTSTITKTLVYASATVTVHMSTSSANSTAATSTIGPMSGVPLSAQASATASTPANYLGNGAGSEQSNIFIVGLAGAAALVLSSL